MNAPVPIAITRDGKVVTLEKRRFISFSALQDRQRRARQVQA
jgi:hypothetical protein